MLIHCLEVKEGHPFAHMMVACFSQQAVPFFFIVSGFFFTKKLDSMTDSKKFLLEYVKRQLFLYGAWILLRLPAMIIFYVELYQDASVTFIIAIILRRIFLAGYDVYWYLLALAESALIVGIFILHRKEKILYFFAVAGLFLGYMCDANINIPIVREINRGIDLVFSGSNNLIMKGIPYVTIGTYFARNIEKINIKKGVLYGGYAIVSILNVAYFVKVYNIDPNLSRFMFLHSIQAILLFIFAINAQTLNLSEEMCLKFRGISTAIFYLHTIFIYYFVDVVWGVNSSVLLKYIVSIVMSIGIYGFVRKTKCKFFYRLLSIR